MIKLTNKKLHDLIVLKDNLVTEGRKISADIEKAEKKLKIFEEKEKKITGAVEPDATLKEEGDLLVIEFNKILNRLEVIGNEIEKKKLESIPQELADDHKQLLKDKEKMERERNKIALKVQKVKDRVIPIIQREVKPHLEEYDDIETAKAKNGEVIVTTFNHLKDWQSKFKSRQG